MSTDIRLSIAQISKINPSGRSFGSRLGNLGKKALKNIAILLARDNLHRLASNLTLHRLASNLTSSGINKIGRKISGKGAVKVKNLLYLFQMRIWIILLKPP